MNEANKSTRQFSSFTLTNPATTRLWVGGWDDVQTKRTWPYQTGAVLKDGPYQVVLGWSVAHTIVCTAEPDPNNPAKMSYQVYWDTFIGQSIPVRRLSVPGLGPDGAKVPFVGIVPLSGASMIGDFSLGKPVDIRVVNGTFAIWLPAGAKPVGADGTVWVKVMDGNGAALFNGYVPLK
jgi:hypothetical protein